MDAAGIENVLRSVGVTEYDANVVAAMHSILQQEAQAIDTTARSIAAVLRTSAGAPSATDPSVVALAIKENRFPSAPARGARMDTARIANAADVRWPLGPHVRVPLEHAVAHRADGVLREGVPTVSVAVVSGAHARSHELGEGGGVPSMVVRASRDSAPRAMPSALRTNAALTAFGQEFDGVGMDVG